MIRSWKKNYPLSIAKCYNPLNGVQKKRLMVDGNMILNLGEIGFATKRAFKVKARVKKIDIVWNLYSTL